MVSWYFAKSLEAQIIHGFSRDVKWVGNLLDEKKTTRGADDELFDVRHQQSNENERRCL